MNARGPRAFAVLLLAIPVAAGCMQWKPGWVGSGITSGRSVGAVGEDLAQAHQASLRAVDAEGLRAAMKAYESVLARDERNYDALAALADHSILMGTAYTEGRAAKRELYERAMRLAETAMYTNPDFKRLADGGKRPWEACTVLTAREMSAMMTWMTAVLYNFKECMSGPARVFNIKFMTHLDPMLDRMEHLDERWEAGAVPFTRAFYYFVVPHSLGGDRNKAALSFERAVEMGPTRAINRWGRARFFDVKMKNRKQFTEDLNWVATSDLESLSDAPAWKAYVRNDARKLLERVDDLF